LDHLDKIDRSLNMSKIKSKNTKPELIVRKLLYEKGFRYRLHIKDLPGKPDICNKKRKIIVEVKGCFWHQHQNCKYSTKPKTNTAYWLTKIVNNSKRDIKNKNLLEKLGFKVFTIWECETKKSDLLNEKISQIIQHKQNLL